MDYQDGPDSWDERGERVQDTDGMRADTYEQLKLTTEQRKLEVAKRKKFAEKRPCLEIGAEIARLKLEIAKESRLRAEAERDRVKQLRLLRRDRRRLAELKKQIVDVKNQAGRAMERIINVAKAANDYAEIKLEKEMWEAVAESFDPAAVEFCLCPQCGEQVSVPEQSCDRICPHCEHRMTR